MKVVVVVVNHCFTSLFGTKGLLSDISKMKVLQIYKVLSKSVT